jgi:hypothetical protein
MYSLDLLIKHTQLSINNAYYNISKLSDNKYDIDMQNRILELDGMTGEKTRHLYNNICNLNGATYLEVGTWKGSSFISALFENNIHGISIDNWSQFDGPKTEFHKNIKEYLSKNIASYDIIDNDCWKVDNIIHKIDIFLYDGAHEYEDQKNAITHFHKFFSKYLIILIDDWTCALDKIKKGTLDGIKEMNLIIHYMHEIPLVNTTTHHTGGNTFWNGCGVFVCERTDI